MPAAAVQAGGPAYALPDESGAAQDGEGRRVVGVGDGLDPVQGQFAEGKIGEGFERVGSDALAAVFGGEEEIGLGGAVDEVLLDEGDVADRGAVREEDEEVVPVPVLRVGLDALAEFVEGAGPDADLVGGHRVGPPAVDQFGVVGLDGSEGDVTAPPESLPRGVRRRCFVLVHARIVRSRTTHRETDFAPWRAVPRKRPGRRSGRVRDAFGSAVRPAQSTKTAVV